MKEIDKVLDESEKIIWEGKPQFMPYLFTRILGMVLFGGIFLAFSLFAVSGNESVNLLYFPHFWVGIFITFILPIIYIISYKYIYYVITNKRIIIQKGWIGRDFKFIDFDQITNAEVDVNLFDLMFSKSSGSIRIMSAGTFVNIRRGKHTFPYTLSNIRDPYDVFKFFKKVSHDVKTDIQYPNAYRPSSNPGYNSEYKIRKPRRKK